MVGALSISHGYWTLAPRAFLMCVVFDQAYRLSTNYSGYGATQEQRECTGGGKVLRKLLGHSEALRQRVRGVGVPMRPPCPHVLTS